VYLIFKVQLGLDGNLDTWIVIITSTLVMTRCMTICFCNIVSGYTCKSFKVIITPCPWNTLCFHMAIFHNLNPKGMCLCFMLFVIN